MKPSTIGIPFPRPTQQTNSTETCISRSTFRSLSTGVHLDYARFYGLSDAGTLTTDQICNTLFSETEWTPALEIEGHVRHTTAEGVIVAKDVMDLVDLLVSHHTESTSPHIRLKSPEETDVQARREGVLTGFLEHHDEGANRDIVEGNYADLSHNDLQRVAEDLQRSHVRLKKSVEASRKAMREACADIFVLQGQLEEEKQYQTDVTTTVTSAVGVEGIQRIQAQLDMDKTEYPMTRSGVKRKQGTSNSNITRISSMSPNPPYHVLTFPSTSSRASASASPKHHGETVDVTHDDQHESDFQPHKRPRLAEYVPTTILNYTSDDKSDDTYSDSEGTNRDFEDDAYSFFNSRGYSPRVELSEESELSSETDDPQVGIRWGSIPSFDNDPADTDYQPPDWDMEDIWELEAPWRSRYHPLFTFEYSNELRQCQGVMSDASLSTDDPDKGYNDLGKLRLKTLRFSSSLGRMLSLPIWDDDDNYRVSGDEEVVLATEIAIERYRKKSWRRIQRMVENGFYPVDFEERLADLLKSDHSEFFFEDEIWKEFEPHPVSSRRAEPPSPKVLSFMESFARGLLDRWE